MSLTCPLPENETARLAALQAFGLLDTPPEPEFDATTRIAASLFDTPIALVALMDRDRLWFKARHGLDLAQLDRAIAFCAHAIADPDRVMVVEDLQADPRFADNPLVCGGPRLRFYAGAPLRTAQGQALGTVAVLDTRPRTLAGPARELLQDLALTVMTAIEARSRGAGPAPGPDEQPITLVPAAARAGRCEECAEGIAPPMPFSMAFQPIVDVAARQVFAYEALVRGPKGEPAVTVLERVTRRNRYAFDQSCRRTAIELAAGLGLVQTGAKLSINFIPGAMYEPENCVRATLAAARRANLPGKRLVFEVTEGEQVLEPAHLARIFEVYRGHGFLPAIDDFGAGYAGLNLLARFQPEIIKLDRELIANIDASRPQQSIVRAVLTVCSDLGITPVAEGVETPAEYRTLQDLGIRLFQGYLFARPAFEAFPAPVFPD